MLVLSTSIVQFFKLLLRGTLYPSVRGYILIREKLHLILMIPSVIGTYLVQTFVWKLSITEVILVGVQVERYSAHFNIANPSFLELVIFPPPAEFSLLRNVSGNHESSKQNYFPKFRHNICDCLS